MFEDVIAMMGFGHNKAVRRFKESESISLVERKKTRRRGVFACEYRF